MVEVYFVDGTCKLFDDIVDVKPHKEDNPKLMLLKGKGREVLLNLDQVQYILYKN